ncbi:branched-chain amino acid ABC transporter permease [Amnibacterium endophyticum]|uniref:Branched-chain amino acid ABC transporter permease n=1 Tax=Amnibacterium endophyticum TaxID=2109337 RepID=A0ABW4LE89_9MICO
MPSSVRNARTRRANPLILLLALLGAALAVLTGAAPATAATTPSPTPSSSVTGSPTPSPSASVVENATIQAVAPPCRVDAGSGCIAGTLRDGNGNAVKGVRVAVSTSSGDTATATSTATGQFAFKVSESGTYNLTVNRGTLPNGVTAPENTRQVQAVVGALRAAFFPLEGTFSGSEATGTQQNNSFLARAWRQVSQGLLLGLLLALAAIGLSLIYGTTGLSNFAHAEQVTLGGLLGYLFAIQLGLPFVLATVLAVICCAATGYVQDRLLWSPLRRKGLPLTQLMVVTIGLSLAAQYLFQYLFGPQVLPVSNSIQRNTGPLDITPAAYWSMLVSIVVLVLVGLALQRTRLGRAARAVADNRALAAASGIDVDFVIRVIWTVAMGLAGLSGVLYGLVYGGVSWSTGVALLLLLFAAVTLGGLGTAFGALVGSLVIGLVVQLSTLFLSNNVKYATALLILIVVLIFRPQGILGRKERVG